MTWGQKKVYFLLKKSHSDFENGKIIRNRSAFDRFGGMPSLCGPQVFAWALGTGPFLGHEGPGSGRGVKK